MNEVIVVDADVASRAELIQLLSNANFTRVQNFPSMKDTLVRLSTLNLNKAIFFLTMKEGFEVLGDFMQTLRQKNQDACVIMTVGSITDEDVRNIVQLGVDQILVRPFDMPLLVSKISAAQAFRQQVIQESLSRPNNSTFEAKVEVITEKFFKVTLSGWFGENCSLPDIRPDTKDNTLFLRCDLFRGMNSVGIRLWLMWLKELATKRHFIRFEFENVQPAILQQASMIQGIIPDTGSINSFYLNYWCEANDSEKKFKFVRGKDYSTSKMRVPLKREEVENGQALVYTLDNPVEKTLKFYKGQIETV
jgi:DNA-binding response OmpR family regulator